MQNTADLGCPDDFSHTKNLLSLLFNNKTEVMRFRVLRFESEFKQSFRHLHFWASSLSSVIPFPLYLLSCTPAPRFPITAVVNRALHRNTSDQAAMATCLISNIGVFFAYATFLHTGVVESAQNIPVQKKLSVITKVFVGFPTSGIVGRSQEFLSHGI